VSRVRSRSARSPRRMASALVTGAGWPSAITTPGETSTSTQPYDDWPR
jgi:hypothetical protein